jgi:hypothetical protein
LGEQGISTGHFSMGIPAALAIDATVRAVILSLIKRV